jgi:hypothetical protein
MIPKQMIREWCETYEEAIETLDYLANRSVGTAKEEIREGLEDFFIDNGLMSEEEFKLTELLTWLQLQEVEE